MPFNQKRFRSFRCPDQWHQPLLDTSLTSHPRCLADYENAEFTQKEGFSPYYRSGRSRVPTAPLQAGKTLEERAEDERWREGRSRMDGEALPWSEANPNQKPAPGGRRRRTAQPVEGSAGAFHFKPALWSLLAEAACVHAHTAHTRISAAQSKLRGASL